MTDRYEQEEEIRKVLTEQEIPEALIQKVLSFRKAHPLSEAVAERLRKPVMPF